MLQVKQSDATGANRWIPFRCFDDDSADNYAPKTGLTFSSGELKIAKAGVANANAANYATVVEAGLGWYWYQASATEVNTLGALMLVVNKTDVYADASIVQVVAVDPNNATTYGLTNLDAAITSRLASADYEDLDTMLDVASSIETGLSLRGALRLMAAALAGKSSGAGTSAEYYRAAVSDSKVRITATISENNRTAITYDAS
jgi:hypothetical protein